MGLGVIGAVELKEGVTGRSVLSIGLAVARLTGSTTGALGPAVAGFDDSG